MTSQADIALASLSMLYNRYLAIDFLHPIVQPSRFIFIKKDLFKVWATLFVLLVGLFDYLDKNQNAAILVPVV